MKITVERLASKKGWVAYPHSAGRPVHGVTKANASRRATVIEATTKVDAVAGVLKAVGFKPARLF